MYQFPTEKGILKLKIKISLYPLTSKEPNRRIEFLTLRNITGWRIIFYDAILKITGRFKYIDGTTKKLTDGTGVNEHCGFQLNDDLNAARNIITAPISPFATRMRGRGPFSPNSVSETDRTAMSKFV